MDGAFLPGAVAAPGLSGRSVCEAGTPRHPGTPTVSASEAVDVGGELVHLGRQLVALPPARDVQGGERSLYTVVDQTADHAALAAGSGLQLGEAAFEFSLGPATLALETGVPFLEPCAHLARVHPRPPGEGLELLLPPGLGGRQRPARVLPRPGETVPGPPCGGTRPLNGTRRPSPRAGVNLPSPCGGHDAFLLTSSGGPAFEVRRASGGAAPVADRGGGRGIRDDHEGRSSRVRRRHVRARAGGGGGSRRPPGRPPPDDEPRPPPPGAGTGRRPGSTRDGP